MAKLYLEATRMIILGVDPGIHGGLAIVAIDNGAAPQLVEAIDIPVIGTGAKERVDAIAIREWVSQHDVQHASMEIAQAMPKQGVSSVFKYGRAAGAIEATIALCGIPLIFVAPAGWKRAFRLPGGNKEAARQRALELFPVAHDSFARKKDHGRAEAALIAIFGAQVLAGMPAGVVAPPSTSEPAPALPSSSAVHA
jgi:crossover junction endodeoxyribonuclease RuvC